jgi:hypothetical protein
MSSDDRFGFTHARVIAVSPAALAMAREFAQAARETRPGKDWLVCFDWAYSRTMRFPRPGGPMQELGPGLDLTAYERSEVPKECVDAAQGFEFAVKVPSSVWLHSQRRLIDVDNSTSSLWRLVLR